MKCAARQSRGKGASLSRDTSRCLEMRFPVFSNRHFPLKRRGKLGMQQLILNRYILSVTLLSVQCRYKIYTSSTGFY